jgi:HD-GYP domain-containing protein (c-di-GMP phosphodiesterase class II)
VKELGLGRAVAAAVEASEEHWDGRGPRGMRQSEIPLAARILGLAQTVDVFTSLGDARDGIGIARARRGTWFDPVLVDALVTMEDAIDGWSVLDEQTLHQAVCQAEPSDASWLASPAMLDRIARSFAVVVDSKSPFTAGHSTRVARHADQIAAAVSLSESERKELVRAALFHDLGMLSVPNSILDKPGRLTASQWDTVRLHPYYTKRILDRVSGFRSLAEVASSHHERLDGRGYFRGAMGDQISLAARILAVADAFDALTSPRSFRPALRPEEAFRVIELNQTAGIGGDCIEALGQTVDGGEPTSNAA